MSLASQLLAWFPAVVLGLAAGCALWIAAAPGPAPVIALLLVLYGLPLATFHVHARWRPLREGVEHLVGSDYSPWWASHQLQWIYLAFPALEVALRAVPGLFSAWLRAWGSRIGHGVYWTPHVTVADRSLLEIGDRVVFGHQVAMSSHVVRPLDDGELLCVVRRVRIGDGAFVGAGAVLGPGARVPPGGLVEAGSVLAGGGLRRSERR